MVTEIGNPTMPTIKEDIMSKVSKEWAKTHEKILNTFLTEYMEVNGIEESELKERLVLGQHPEGIAISEGENTPLLNIQWGKITQTPTDMGVEVTITLTTELHNKEKYPKTDAFLQTLQANDTKCNGVINRTNTDVH